MYTKKGAQGYSQVDLESKVMGADPHQLIQLLMEGALTRIASAKKHMQAKENDKKAEALGKAVDILSALQQSLDHEKGDAVAENLEKLYDYMVRRLFDATVTNDPDLLDEVMKLLLEVKKGWDGIREEYLELRKQGKSPDLQQGPAVRA